MGQNLPNNIRNNITKEVLESSLAEVIYEAEILVTKGLTRAVVEVTTNGQSPA